MWTSRARHSDLMLLLARTTPVGEVKRRTDGLSVFLVDLRENLGHGVEIRPIETMINHNPIEVFFDNLQVPPENLIGEEGRGFRYILDGMNAERILVAQECIGDGPLAAQRGHRICQGTHRLRPPDRSEPRGPVPIGARLCRARSGPMAGAVMPDESWCGPKTCCSKRSNAIQTARWHTTRWQWCPAAKDDWPNRSWNSRPRLRSRNNARAYFSYGTTLVFLGQPPAAIAHIEKALRLNPDPNAGNFYWSLGMCHLPLNDTYRAIGFLTKTRWKYPWVLCTHVSCRRVRAQRQ